MKDDFPGKATAPALVAGLMASDKELNRETVWGRSDVIRTACGDLLARLNFFHGDDTAEREVTP
ncbi:MULTISPECIES: hypothetical protein [unclassified Bradyrhizobium]|uniref:hypothetical protein n=1 Tax=unclassified Bradyrhizobium TaxID=2631580 RepID=UPI0029163804|nr:MULTISPECIES: hypothetical protein [unclassified Bradyrhizobium]